MLTAESQPITIVCLDGATPSGFPPLAAALQARYRFAEPVTIASPKSAAASLELAPNADAFAPLSPGVRRAQDRTRGLLVAALDPTVTRALDIARGDGALAVLRGLGGDGCVLARALSRRMPEGCDGARVMVVRGRPDAVDLLIETVVGQAMAWGASARGAARPTGSLVASLLGLETQVMDEVSSRLRARCLALAPSADAASGRAAALDTCAVARP